MAEIALEIEAAATEQRDGAPPRPQESSEEEGRRWRAEIRASQKAQQKWIDRGRKIEKLYRDERDERSDRSRRFNILWANVETLRPAVYMIPPKPRATRRQMDRDPVARLAAQLLERCLQASCELYGLDHTVDQMVRDWLLPGRGQAWIVYQPTLSPMPPAQPTQLLASNGAAADALAPQAPLMLPSPEALAPTAPQPPDEDVTYEEVIADYVPWGDFLHSAGARTWAEVTWVGRRLLFTRAKGRKRFGEAFDKAPMSWKASRSGTARGDGDDERGRISQAEIIEVWDKDSGDVLFVAPDAPDESAILERKPAPIHFRNFYPCPRPLLATTTSESLIPTPDYAQYQDQAQELNTLTARIDKLQKALKVAGLYPAESKEIGKLLEATEGTMIAVEQWAMHAEDGGTKGMVDWYPVENVIIVLRELYLQRDSAKQNLYEISGIADIMRGVSDPNETLGAQQIKQRWSGTRLRKRQKEVQRVTSEIFNLKAEVIAEVFQFSTILEMASADQEMIAKYLPQGADPMQFLAEVERMLRNDATRTFQIKVAPDSTLEPDEQAEQQSRSQVVGAIAQILEKGAPLAEKAPEGAKLVGGLLQFVIRAFKDADQLEETISAATEAMANAVAQAKANPPPNPEMEKLKIEAQGQQADGAYKQQQLQAQAENDQAAHGLEQQKMEAEAQKTAADLDLKRLQMQAEHERTMAEIALKNRELDLKERELAIKESELAQRDVELQHRARELDAAAEQRTQEMTHRETELAQRGREIETASQHKEREFTQREREFEVQNRAPADEGEAEIGGKNGARGGGIGRALLEMAQGLKEAAAAMQSTTAAMAAPMRIVRDEAGRAIGSERMLGAPA